MKLICCTFSEMEERIKKNNSRIVMVGAGTIGSVSVPEILKKQNLLKYVDCYVDSDKRKMGNIIQICDSLFVVNSISFLNNCSSNTVLLLNISRFSEIITQLESMKCTNCMDCFIMPMMLIHNFCSTVSGGVAEKSEEPLIPKKIHYMWLGKGYIPDRLRKCIESWKKYCPDYEIIEWNENNYDIGKNKYMIQAYEKKAYGFVPDYARLDILYNEGGLYLDIDVEIKKNIDQLLFQEAFCSVEKWQVVNFGGMSGAIKKHPMIKKLLDARQSLLFINPDGSQNRNTCGYYDTRTVLNEGYCINGKTQNVCGMNIYAYDYFHAYDYMSGVINETSNTYSIHWFNGGWLDRKAKELNEETKKRYLNLYKEAIDLNRRKGYDP